MIITAITAQVKNKNRVNLFLDGNFACGLSLLAVMRAGLKVGAEISAQRLEELRLESEGAASMDAALKYLGFKPISRYKMRQYLVQKDFDEDIAQNTVDRLTEMGYLDDAALAVMYVKSYSKKYGNHLIKHKLREMGISSEDIAAALPDDETTAAREIAVKYLRTHKPDRNKLYSYLSNKGFSSSAARSALDLVNSDNNYED